MILPNVSNGNGGGDGRQVLYDSAANPYYDLNAEVSAACPVPDDNTAYKGIRYWGSTKNSGAIAELYV